MKTTALQRVINCLRAEARSTDENFKEFWALTAQKIATKSHIDISDVKNNLEIYDAGEAGIKTRSYH